MSPEFDASQAAGAPPGMDVRLSSNEAPFGPSPGAIDAILELAGRAHLYPDDQSVALREAIAAHEDRDVAEVAAGTGSAGLLMDIIAHECSDGGAVVTYERAFIVYRLGAGNVGAPYVEAPTDGPATGAQDGYGRDVEALLDAVDEDTAVVIVDNPGNPTGRHLTGAELRTLAAGVPDDVTLVIDEAYHQFATGQDGYQTAAEAGLEHPRLLVTRTFSKAYALAGLRVGYLLGPAELVHALDSYRVRFNVNAAAQRAAVAALEDEDHLDHTVAATLEGRDRMLAGLRELGVPATGGLGNFVTVELGEPSPPIVEAYAEHGVGVRPLGPYGMTEQLRVTVGTPAEVDAFLTASKDVLASVASRS